MVFEFVKFGLFFLNLDVKYPCLKAYENSLHVGAHSNAFVIFDGINRHND